MMFVLALCFPCLAFALGPHEVLVLANEKSPDSVQVAKAFMKLRQVPEINMVRLAIPPSADGVVSEDMTPDDFARLIWSPAMLAMRVRGIDDHILAWVYSVDFPTRINVEPFLARISVQGLTFVRNAYPNFNVISNGAYASPLFAGPGAPGNVSCASSQSFDLLHEWLGDEMPIPSMMLGHTGRHGMAVDAIIKCLETGLSSDGTSPDGTIYFVKTDNIRSSKREWQYPQTVKQLVNMGIKAVVTDAFPDGKTDVMGIMTGAEHVEPQWVKRFLPGCMAEHLTSAAGIFDDDNQTKLSEWLSFGVTASAGTVTEPFAIWTKFPSAPFFVHYASGCTMIESFYQSIRCPLQIVLVGEPLAQPWAPRAKLTLAGLSGDSLSGKIRLRPVVETESSAHYTKYVCLLDGKTLDVGENREIDTTRINDGQHTLRVVAYRTGLVRCQIFTEKTIIVDNSRKLEDRGQPPSPGSSGAPRKSEEEYLTAEDATRAEMPASRVATGKSEVKGQKTDGTNLAVKATSSSVTNVSKKQIGIEQSQQATNAVPAALPSKARATDDGGLKMEREGTGRR